MFPLLATKRPVPDVIAVARRSCIQGTGEGRIVVISRFFKELGTLTNVKS
jgi:hypothetical protein